MKPEVAIEPIRATKEKTKRQISSQKSREGFLSEIGNEERNKNRKILREYFNYQTPSFLKKQLYKDNQNKNDKIVEYLNESLINLRNYINSKEIPEKQKQKK